MKRILLFAAILCSLSAFALDPTQFTITRVTSPYFVIDGNSPTTGPLSAYVGFKITNTSASTTWSNLKFTITSVTTSVVGQNYTLVSPATGITLVGTLAPGQSKVCYYYTNYPGSTTAQATFNYTLSDLTGTSKTGSAVVYNRSSISANAGGLATQSISNQDLLGGIVYDDVTYTLGNIKSGDENDFQVSVSTGFDPTKLVLLKTAVTASTVPGITAGTNDLLYFSSTANQSSGTVTIRWTFKISAFNFTTLILPYAGATSGSTNYKYAISTDLGSGTPIAISSSANPLIITKTADKSLYTYNSTATFTVTIQNPATNAVSIDKITDEIPAGFTFQSIDAASAVAVSNSTTYPTTGATGTITFEGGVASGANTSYLVPANGSISLKYTATSPSSTALNLTTTARGYIGTTQFGAANNTLGVSGTLPVTIQSFSGNIVNGKAKLQWTTSGEMNSSLFEIERSGDGRSYYKIGTVNASGSSASTKAYSFTDSSAFNGTAFFRLKMIDLNGQYKYSSILPFKLAFLSPVEPAGNPFSNNLQLNLALTSRSTVEVRIVNTSGQIMIKKQVNGAAGVNTINLNTGALANGVYFLQSTIEGKTLSKKIIKD